ncbi:hypothetical protein [Aliiroseovarius sp.]|uniref:hypothetical protein n=1 Tax=Aliiroseovarius sp. TaxID=1872442 RepID=UPI002610ED76|nr:hypothetical protein [Aliiroseovarius sp.]
MRWLVFLLISTPALADPLLGRWGTPAQCAGRPVLEGGTRLAAPFEIGPEWLRQGEVWCRLTWFDAQPQSGGLFRAARALCGEDSVRGYNLGFVLEGEALTILWDERLVNGPLRRCD